MDYEGENVIEVKNGVEYEYTSNASNGMDFSNISHALGCDKLGRAGKVMGMQVMVLLETHQIETLIIMHMHKS